MSGYIGTQPVPQATQTRDAFTATAGQTSFATGGYTPQFLDVFLNGVHIQNATDFTATNGSDVVLTTGAALGDVLEVVAYSTFDSANTYNRTEADAEFVSDPNDVITVSGSNVGIGTTSPESTPSTKLHIREDDSTDYRARAVVQATDQRLVLGSHWQAGVGQYSYVQATNSAETAAQTLSLNPDGGAVTMPYQPLANVIIHDHNTSGVHAGAGVSALNYGAAMSQGGMSVTSDRITVPVAGKYYVSARQLNGGNGGEYFNILLNGTNLGYGYNSDTAPLHDLNVDVIASMSANDYIQVSYNTATANRFEGGHSNLLIHLIG
jgi:hypothetical protein